MSRDQLVLITSRGYWSRIKWLSIGVTPFILMAFSQAVHGWGGHDGHMMALMMMLVAAMMAAGPVLLLVARRRWVELFDHNGVQLRNGKRFKWIDFVRCEPRMNTRLRTINNYDLVFRTGTAGVYHLMVENYGQLMAVIEQLKAGQNPFTE